MLAVEETVVCPWYDVKRDGSVCPSPTSGLPATVTRFPKRIQLFGVGFGRKGDGQPQSGRDKNAFLNVLSIDGKDVGEGFRNGYVIEKEGVRIGLTEENTAGMKFVELREAEEEGEWMSVEACLKVGETECFNGTVLIDTGISHAYLTLPLGANVSRHAATSPSSGGVVQVLDDGSFVQLDFGSGVEEDFVVVNSTETEIKDETPNMVITTLANPAVKPPFFNSGAHFLRKWAIAFDAVGGRFGFRKV